MPKTLGLNVVRTGPAQDSKKAASARAFDALARRRALAASPDRRMTVCGGGSGARPSFAESEDFEYQRLVTPHFRKIEPAGAPELYAQAGKSCPTRIGVAASATMRTSNATLCASANCERIGLNRLDDCAPRPG
jgi:hypothetical protein